MPAKVYSDQHADLKYLQNKTLAVLGFGSQGHAHALNLKDSGCNVIIGLYEGSKSIPVAKSHGFEVVSTAEAVRRAVAALPERLRVPLILSEYEEKSHAEIGQILACSAKAVEVRVYRARRQLRASLAQWLETT